jgi:hypothetical protein
MSWHPECYQAATGQAGKPYIAKFGSNCQAKESCQHGGLIRQGTAFVYSTYIDYEQKSHSQSTAPKTSMVAKRINAIVIDHAYALDNELWLETTCRDYDHLKELPEVVSYEGIICGRTGWNSDRQLAYYKSTAKVALPIKG